MWGLIVIQIAFSLITLDPISIDNFRLIELVVPRDDPFCALQPGENRSVLMFSGFAKNLDEDEFRGSWSIAWSLSCPNSTQNGVIQVPCLADTVCEDPVFHSCAVSGLSSKCKSRINPALCDMIDVTDILVHGCMLTFDGQLLDVSSVSKTEDFFERDFAIIFLFTLVVSGAAFLRSFIGKEMTTLSGKSIKFL
jgi:hypothetical protein